MLSCWTSSKSIKYFSPIYLTIFCHNPCSTPVSGFGKIISLDHVNVSCPHVSMEYLLERNRPRYSLYSNHSMFFFIAPLLIAGKYPELTGDRHYFLKNSQITDKLEEVYQGILAHKHRERKRKIAFTIDLFSLARIKYITWIKGSLRWRENPFSKRYFW